MLTAEALLIWEEPEDPKVERVASPMWEVPDDPKVERVLSMSDDSGVLEPVEGACGWEQDGQLHGANLWYSDAVLMPEHLRWHQRSQEKHRKEVNPPATPTPQTEQGNLC